MRWPFVGHFKGSFSNVNLECSLAMSLRLVTVNPALGVQFRDVSSHCLERLKLIKLSPEPQVLSDRCVSLACLFLLIRHWMSRRFLLKSYGRSMY